MPAFSAVPRRLSFLTGAAAAVLLCAPVSPADAGVDKGDRAAEFVAVKDGRSRRMKLKKFRGKVVVLTFGASWCKPCKKELPAWDKLARKFKDRGVVFIAVNVDSDVAKGKAFIKKAKLEAMRVGYEPSAATADSYDPPTMPTTYVIDTRGVVRHRHKGYRSGDEKVLAKQLRRLLAK